MFTRFVLSAQCMCTFMRFLRFVSSAAVNHRYGHIFPPIFYFSPCNNNRFYDRLNAVREWNLIVRFDVTYSTHEHALHRDACTRGSYGRPDRNGECNAHEQSIHLIRTCDNHTATTHAALGPSAVHACKRSDSWDARSVDRCWAVGKLKSTSPTSGSAHRCIILRIAGAGKWSGHVTDASVSIRFNLLKLL